MVNKYKPVNKTSPKESASSRREWSAKCLKSGSFQEGSLSGGQLCNSNTIRRTADVVQTDSMTKMNRLGIATMFATYSYFKVFARSSAFSDGNLHQSPDTLLIDAHERIFRQKAIEHISRQKLPRVVT